MVGWDTGCSLSQDRGYEDYLRKKSMAQFAYQFSCVAPAACPETGPMFSECRGFAPADYRIPQETTLWQQKVTRGRQDLERRPQTVMAGTSAFRGAAQHAREDKDIAIDNTLRYDNQPLQERGQRKIMEQIPGRLNLIDPLVPKVESFRPGGVDSRCNKLAYKTNPNNAFVACAPMPPPMTTMTGVFPPGFPTCRA